MDHFLASKEARDLLSRLATDEAFQKQVFDQLGDEFCDFTDRLKNDPEFLFGEGGKVAFGVLSGAGVLKLIKALKKVKELRRLSKIADKAEDITYKPGDRLPDGRIAGEGPGAAFKGELDKVGNRPANLSPDGAGRRGAFREAKRKNGIPVNQQPSSVKPNVDRRGKRQPGRQYEYDTPEGKKTIRDDAGGHNYPDDPSQNRGSHFNDEAGNHYDY